MSAQHTPGPWFFSTAYNGDCGIKAAATGVFAEAFTDIRHSGENNCEEARANARLIAAAPDLLEVAKQALASLTTVGIVVDGDIHQNDPTVPALRAAIAKATGAA